MAVDHTLDVRTLLVDLQVKQSFAGSLFDAGDLLAGHVDRANIFDLEESFAVHGRCTKNFVVADSHRDISIVGSGKAFVVEPTSDFADILFDFMSIDSHG
jgi:hypothetical protein